MISVWHTLIRYARLIKIGPVERVSRGIFATGGFALLGISLAPHLFPSLCRERHEAKLLGDASVPDNDITATVFRESAEKLGLSYPSKVTLFVSDKLSAVSAGSTLLPNGAVIGIPRSLYFRTEDSVRCSGLTFNGQCIKWESSKGKELAHCFVTDDKHLAFTVAHELSHLVNHDFVVRSLFPTFWYFMTYKVIHGISSLFKRSRMGLAVYGILIPVSLLTSVTCFFSVMQRIFYSQEFKADEMAAKCSLDHCIGGIDYMTRRLRTDKILCEMYPGTYKARCFKHEGDDRSITHPSKRDRIKLLGDVLWDCYQRRQ